MPRQRKVMSQINVVPYIDVMLVLLVIFMVTAPLLPPAQVELPSVAKSSQPPVAPLEVVIHKDQSMVLRNADKNGSEQKVRQKDLIDLVQSAQGKDPGRAVVIAADKDVRYEAVLKVMDDLQRNNVAKVGLLVQPAR